MNSVFLLRIDIVDSRKPSAPSEQAQASQLEDEGPYGKKSPSILAFPVEALDHPVPMEPASSDQKKCLANTQQQEKLFHCFRKLALRSLAISRKNSTVMHCLVTGIGSEKTVVRRFHHCVNITG